MTSVIGLDLSLTSTGAAEIRDGKLVELVTFKSTGKKGDSIEKRGYRLDGMHRDIWSWVNDEYVDLVVVEAPSYGSTFGSPHDRSGLWWLVVRDLIINEIPVAMVSPQGRAKYATGNGRSKKPEVFAACKDRYGSVFRNDDEADALLCASVGARHLGQPLEPAGLPDANLAALSGVHWPTVTEWEEAA